MINFTSIIGLDAKTFFSICVSVDAPPTDAKYLMAYLALTVFPAPLSPLTMIDWFSPSLNYMYKKKKVFTVLLHISVSLFVTQWNLSDN